MMRIAYFSPVPPQCTGVADYSMELLPHLAKMDEIDLFVDGEPRDFAIPEGPAVRNYREFERLAHQYQACIYHLGNDPAHEYILETMLGFPSIAVLHDVSLHPLLVALTIGRGDLVGYIREMGYAYGPQGVAEARAAYVGRYFRYEDFPLCQRAIDLNLGIIVHSKFAADSVRSLRPLANVAVVPHGVSRAEVATQEECRQRLGLEAGGFMVAALGLATPNKRLEPALRAFTRFHASRPDSRFLLVGEVPSWYNLKQISEDLGLGEEALFTGRVPIGDFYAYAAAADVCLALRYPTNGETSGSLLRSMSVGRPVVVSGVGSFAELPPNTCIHVPAGEGEEDAILEAMERLAGDETLRKSIGQAARDFVEREHSWQRAAEGYHGFIKQTLDSLS